MVLTEPLARRLFGDNDPIGQVIRYEERFDCEVTGIVGQPPASSLLQFSALLSFATEYEENREMMESEAGTSQPSRTFVQLTPGADPAAVAVTHSRHYQGGDGDVVKMLPGPTALQPLKIGLLRHGAVSSSVFGPRGNPFYLTLCVPFWRR